MQEDAPDQPDTASDPAYYETGAPSLRRTCGLGIVMSGRRPAIKGEFGSATVTGAVMSPAFERGVYPLALMFVR